MIDSMFQEGTDKVLDDRVARPLNPAPAPPRGFWAATGATLAAPLKGVGAGAVESAGFGSDVLSIFGAVQAGYGLQADPSNLFSSEALDERRQAGQPSRDRLDSGEAFNTETGTGLRAKARSFAPDAATANVAEQILFGLGRFATKAVGYSLAAGPAAGAALTGADEGMTEADKLKGEGVDFTTRTQVGIIAGAAGAAGVALPVAGKTLAQTAALVAAGGPAAFIAQQAASRAILEHADYKALANQYDPFDPVGLAVSTLVPAAFGGYALRAGVRTAAAHPPADPAAARGLTQMAGNERTALAYNDPRLDAYAVFAAQREGIPPEALLAIKNAGEKSGSTMVSPKEAKGVMQFIPDTWKAYGKGDPRDPVASIDAGARYMKDLIKQYDGDVRAAIAHYNGGGKAGAAVRAGRDAPATETRKYLQRTDAYLAERQGAEAGKAASQDPEVVAAARVQLVRNTVADSGLHDPADTVAATEHTAALERAQDQMAAGEPVNVADLLTAERIDPARLNSLASSLEAARAELAPEIGMPAESSALRAMQQEIEALRQQSPDASPETRARIDDLEQQIESGRRADQARQQISGERAATAQRPTVPAARQAEGGARMERTAALDAPPSQKPATEAAPSGEKPAKGATETLQGETAAAARATVQVDGSPNLHGKATDETGNLHKDSAGTALDAQTAEIARLAPDMMVQLEGMDAPMRMADALELIKAEAEREIKDAPLLQVAAECFLRNV